MDRLRRRIDEVPLVVDEEEEEGVEEIEPTEPTEGATAGMSTEEEGEQLKEDEAFSEGC